MTVKVEPCWPTLIGYDNYADVLPNFCNDLVAETIENIDQHGWKRQALWRLPSMGPLQTKLGELLTASGNDYAKAAGWDGDFILGDGWINQNEPGSVGSSTPHAHAGSHFVCVFYPSHAENCGDLLLQDPRGGVFCEPQWDHIDGRHVNCRVYKRFKPKIGDVIFFPGFMIHSVEPNRSRSIRVSFATNFRQRPSPKNT